MVITVTKEDIEVASRLYLKSEGRRADLALSPVFIKLRALTRLPLTFQYRTSFLSNTFTGIYVSRTLVYKINDNGEDYYKLMCNPYDADGYTLDLPGFEEAVTMYRRELTPGPPRVTTTRPALNLWEDPPGMQLQTTSTPRPLTFTYTGNWDDYEF